MLLCTSDIDTENFVSNSLILNMEIYWCIIKNMGIILVHHDITSNIYINDNILLVQGQVCI